MIHLKKLTSINLATFFIIFLFFSLAVTLVCSLVSSSETFLSAISHKNNGSSTNTSENNWNKTKGKKYVHVPNIPTESKQNQCYLFNLPGQILYLSLLLKCTIIHAIFHFQKPYPHKIYKSYRIFRPSHFMINEKYTVWSYYMPTPEFYLIVQPGCLCKHWCWCQYNSFLRLSHQWFKKNDHTCYGSRSVIHLLASFINLGLFFWKESSP